MTLANYFSKNGINGNSVNDRYVEFDLGVFAWYEQRHVVVSAGHGTVKVYATLSEALDRVLELITDEILDRYDAECRDIARNCEREGYFSHGENYELRCDQLWDLYRDKYELYLDKVLRW